jgi:hypothetical protein
MTWRLSRHDIRDTSHCPACGAPLDAKRILIDLGLNLVIFNGMIQSLQPRMAEFLSVMYSVYPRDILTKDVMYKMYGGASGPNGMPREVLGQIYNSHKTSLKKMGIEIVATRHGPHSTRRLKLTTFDLNEHPAVEDVMRCR